MISVVMPIWFPDVDAEAMNITEQAIDSLGGVELVAIDNGSRYGSGWLNNKCRTGVFLRFPENRGYTVAINRGIDLCSNEIIALVNNDIRVSSGWQEQAIDILKDPEIATLHPKMVDYESPFGLGDIMMKTGHERWCQNSFVVTTKTFLNKLKKQDGYVFDENYGIGGGADDWDFAHRVRMLGCQCWTNRICFQHKHSFSLKKLGPEREKIVEQNNEYFFKKWGKTKEQQLSEEFPYQMTQDYYGVLREL